LTRVIGYLTADADSDMDDQTSCVPQIKDFVEKMAEEESIEQWRLTRTQM